MLQLAVFMCAGILAVAVIAFALYHNFGEIADALAGRPRVPTSRELDRWRAMHGAADRRGPYAIADMRAAAPADKAMQHG